MAFDPVKRIHNLDKHGIDLAECNAVFDAPMLTKEDDRFGYNEQRLISLGWLHTRVVVLVWAEDGEEIRLISCREANRYEQKAYTRAFRDQ